MPRQTVCQDSATRFRFLSLRLWFTPGLPLVLLVLGSILPAWGQAPGLLWKTNIGANVFASDVQTNAYALAGTNVIKLGPAGNVLQNSVICPLPGVAQRDSAGNFYFAGIFDGPTDFGGITLVGGWISPIYTPPRWQAGYPTCFLAKYASNGSLLWVVSFGHQGTPNILGDLAVNANDSVTVGFGSQQGAALAAFSASGAKLWQSEFGNILPGQPSWVKVSGLIGTKGGFIRTDQNFFYGGFYDASGNQTGFSLGGWRGSELGLNGKPVVATDNSGYLAGLDYPPHQLPILRKFLADGSEAWTQSIGDVEQWGLAGDSGNFIYLAGTTGIFSKYDSNGVLIWSTNYGAPIVSMLVDSLGHRLISFADGAVARLASEPPPVAPVVSTPPQSQTVFVGSNVSLTVSAIGTPPLRYAWQQNGTNIPNATNAILDFAAVDPSHAGLYTVVVTNVAGAAPITPAATLRVKSVGLYLGSRLLTNGTYVFASPPALSVRSAFAGGSVFYTLDGSAPSFAGTHYSGAFTLAQSATVRAIGYSSDFLQSEEADPVIAIVLAQHQLSTSASAGGSVQLSPPGGIYNNTNVVTATAVAAAGNAFLYWLGDTAGASPSINVSMERDKTIRAVFGTTLATTVAGSGQIQRSPPGTLYPYGSVVRLTAVPDPGNYFGFWGNAATGNTNPLYFTISGPTQTVSSIFGATPSGQVALTVQIVGRGRVTSNPSANVQPLNQAVTLTAIPDAGQGFLNWSGAGSGTQNPLGVSMTQGKVITANFTDRPTLSVNRPGLEGLTPNGFRLTLLSDPSSVWQVMGSTNLTTWESLGWITNIFGEVQFMDPGAANAQQKAYKAGQ